MTEDDSFETGRIVAGRYRVVQAVGQGGMGQVYVCEHIAVGRRVALKVLLPSLAHESVGVRLLKEARTASAAGHPNVVEIIDAGVVEDGRPFVAMELLEGITLRERIGLCPRIPISEVIRIGIETARGVQAVHDSGIVHRDLKPANVMLVEREGKLVVKIVDFGIAFEAGARGRRLTEEGHCLGTPRYMAPEQVFGAEATPAFDIYALGQLLFELCAGESPFGGPVERIYEAKTTRVAPRVERWRPDVPRWLGDLIAECLERNPADRPWSAREVEQRLESGGCERARPDEARPRLVRAEPRAAQCPSTAETHLLAEAPARPARERQGKGKLWPYLLVALGCVGLSVMVGLRLQPAAVMTGMLRTPIIMVLDAPPPAVLEQVEVPEPVFVATE